MPNWCYTIYKIVGQDSDELKDLYTKLTTLQKISEDYSSACIKAHLDKQPQPELPAEIVDSGFTFFLGNVVKAFGGDWEQIYCRGTIASIDDFNGDYFNFSTETAWGEINEVWDFVMKQYKTLEYYYLAEEPGNLHFVSNDMDESHFSENYYIYDSVASESDYMHNKDELLRDMARRLEVEKIESIEELDRLLAKFCVDLMKNEIFLRPIWC